MKPFAAASALISLSAIVSAQSLFRGNCSVFTWNQEPATFLQESDIGDGTFNFGPKRVSAAMACPESENQTCALTARGDAQFRSTTFPANVAYRVESSGRQVDPFVPNVQQAVGNASAAAGLPTFNDSVIVGIDQTMFLEPGQSAYMNFTAYMFCYNGTVSECASDSNLTDGSEIMACAPLFSSRDGLRSARMSGEYTLVNVSSDEVGNFRNPYQNQSSGETGGAQMLTVSWGLLAGIAGLVAFML